MQSVVHGTASSRSTGISLPQTEQVPYVPSSIRASASSTWRSWSRASSSSPSSSSRSYVSLAVSARWLSALDDISSPVSSVRDELPMSWCLIVSQQALAVLEEHRPEVLGVDAHPVSCPPAEREPSVDLVRADAGQLDDLVSRAAARNERDARARNGQRLREQREHRVVRLAALGRRADAHLPRRRRAGRRSRRARDAPGATPAAVASSGPHAEG